MSVQKAFDFEISHSLERDMVLNVLNVLIRAYVKPYEKQQISWEHTLDSEYENLAIQIAQSLDLKADLPIADFYNWAKVVSRGKKIPYSIYHLVRTAFFTPGVIIGKNVDSEEIYSNLSLVESFAPEVFLLEALDPRFATTTRVLLNRVGEGFKGYPSSFTGKYHPEDEFAPCGKLLHTKRACAYFVRWILPYLTDKKMCFSKTFFTEYDLKVGLMALIFHDVFCGGPDFPEGGSRDAYKLHAYYHRSQWGESWNPLTEEETGDVLVAVENHMGKWSTYTRHPENSISWYVHYADYLSSQRDWRVNPLILEEVERIVQQLKPGIQKAYA